MSGIRLNAAKFSNLFGKQIKQRILLDFQSSTPGIRRVLTREFDVALSKAADELLTKAVPEVTEAAKTHYNQSYDVVAHQLKAGLRMFGSIDTGEGLFPYQFKPFTPQYARHKKHARPGTELLYWKFYGHLSRNFRQFAGVRKGAVSRTKSITGVRSRGYKYRGRVYRYQIEVAFPKVNGNPYLDNIFREAYTKGSLSVAPYLPQGLNFEGGTTGSAMDILTLLESGGHKWSRPFITEIMSRRGLAVRGLMLNALNNRWKSVS